MEQNVDNLHDVVVIGGGVAGLTAAIYLSRARYRVVVVEKDHFGGQITITADVVNYPGIERVSGASLTETMRRQAESFGAEFLLAEVESLELSGDVKTVHTNRGDVKCFGVLLATGAHPRMIGFKGEADFQGRGVAYCATCDGEFFTGMDVFVVGGGFAAAEEAVFLTKYARKVTILVRGDDFSCARGTAEAACNHEKITVLRHTEIEEVGGDTALRYLRYRNNDTGEVVEYRPPEGETFGVFVFAGYKPETALIRGTAELDSRDYVVVDHAQRTTVPGLYAAGDVCAKPLRQVVTSAGDGATAATELEKYAEALREKTGLKPIALTSRIASKKDAGPREHAPTVGEGLFTAEMRTQLHGMFEKMARPLVLRLSLDARPVSSELRNYMDELAALTDKLSVEIAPPDKMEEYAPCVQVCHADGTNAGIAFHGVPGGHEFTSFALGLYNAAGPGQSLESETAEAIRAIDTPTCLQVLISLSCTICPEVVIAAQRIAAENANITAEVYDLNHFSELREKYKVMSVPCIVVNNEYVTFGKKNIRQLLDLINQR